MEELSITKSGEIYELEAINTVLAEKSLAHFVKQAWEQVEPETQLIWGWHLDAICDHLQAISAGQISRLIINVPPRHTKSLSVSVMWPCWEWISRPGIKWLFSSYAHDLSLRDSAKCRRLILSDWYQGRWGDRFSITSDQNQKVRFENNHAGYRLASSVRGQNTGEGGDRIVCLPYDTLVVTSCGDIEIGDIVDNRLDVSVLSFNHELGVEEYAEIEEYKKNPARDLLEIELEDGSTLTCTEDHEIYVDGKGYVRAIDLEIDDGVFVQD
ncbi:hypothetical protein DRH14_04005 [Candidatus Shapirobacteria bacterium]|nr:MAG: hypothetical protein DRH14_04005 [Candidatus Shapirobacteria bacterium]